MKYVFHSIQDVLDRAGVEYKAKGEDKNVRTGWIGIECPNCSPGSGSYYLGIHETGLYSNCWRCGPISIVSIISQSLRIPKKDAFEILKQLKGNSVLPEIDLDIVTGKYKPPKTISLTKAKYHKEYLRSRNLNPRDIELAWGVQATTQGKYPWRLFIPVLHNNIPASWTTRAISAESEIRYMSSPPDRESIPLRSLLYGKQYVRGITICTEGPIDAWAIGPGATSTLGVGYSEYHVQHLASIPIRYICFDNEEEAQKRASKLCDVLSTFPGETHNIVLDANDPGSASKKERKLLRSLLDPGQ